MFKVVRFDAILLIIPKSFVGELRTLPEHRLSQRQLMAYVSGFDLFAISCHVNT